MLGRFGFFPWRSNQCVRLWWFSRGGFYLCQVSSMHEISISGDFLGWISYLCQMSSVLVISMTRFFIDYCCSRSIVADVFIRIFIDFSYFSACVGCSLWILIHIFTPVNVVVSLDWPELPHRKGVWKYKWLDSHSYGAMWHLCCKHSEDVFLCMPNITDFWFIEWGFDLLGRQLKLPWLFCDRNLFSYFHWWMQTVCTGELIFRYLEFVFHGNLFSLVLHWNVAFAVWVNLMLDYVSKVWCHSKGWRNLVKPEGFPLLCLLGFECFDTLPRMMKVPTESL